MWYFNSNSVSQQTATFYNSMSVARVLSLTLSFVQVLLAAPTQALGPSKAHSTGPNPVPSPALANQPLTLRRNKGGGLKKMWFYNTDSDWWTNFQ